MIKKQIFYFSVFAVLLILKAFADDLKTNEWGGANCNAQMSIRFNGQKTEFKTNQPVEILVHIKNLSTNETFYIFESNATEESPGFSFVVTFPSGNDISTNTHDYGNSGVLVSLAPKKVVELGFNLNRFYKFDKVGTYKIIAKKAMGTCEIISNPLYLSIVPGEWKPEITNAPPILF